MLETGSEMGGAGGKRIILLSENVRERVCKV